MKPPLLELTKNVDYMILMLPLLLLLFKWLEATKETGWVVQPPNLVMVDSHLPPTATLQMPLVEPGGSGDLQGPKNGWVNEM